MNASIPQHRCETIAVVDLPGSPGPSGHCKQFPAVIVQQTQPDIALINLDSDSQKGLALLQQITSDLPGCAVFVLSSSQEGSLILQAMRMGAKEFLNSPLKLDDFMAALDRLRSSGGKKDKTRGSRVISVCGASGGIGHLAVQLAKRMKARVLAVASGQDGVEFVKRLGADKVIDGHREDILRAAHEFAPKGLDATLLTAGGKGAEQAIAALREGGRAAYPNGVEDVPQAREGVKVTAYNGEPDPKTFAKLNELIDGGPFEVHIARTFKLEEAAEAQRALESHYLGKLALVLS